MLGEDVDLRTLANETPGFAGAEIANLCNEAALLANPQYAYARKMGQLHGLNVRMSPGFARQLAETRRMGGRRLGDIKHVSLLRAEDAKRLLRHGAMEYDDLLQARALDERPHLLRVTGVLGVVTNQMQLYMLHLHLG